MTFIALVPPMYFNVKQYGAIGDGTADDTSAIQRAINAAVASGRGTIFFPSGTYALSSTLTVDAPNITLMGTPVQGNTVLMPTSGADPTYLIQIGTTVNCNNCAVLGLTLQGKNSSSSTGGGVQLRGSNCQIRDCFITLFGGTGIAMSAQSGTISGNVLENVTLTQNGTNTTPGDNLVVDGTVTQLTCIAVSSTGNSITRHGLNVTAIGQKYVDCQSSTCTGDGFHLMPTQGQISILGGFCNQNGTYGINGQTPHIGGVVSSFFIVGMSFTGNAGGYQADVHITNSYDLYMSTCLCGGFTSQANILLDTIFGATLADLEAGTFTSPAIEITGGSSSSLISIHDCVLYSANATVVSLGSTQSVIHDCVFLSDTGTPQIVETTGADSNLYHHNAMNGGSIVLVGASSTIEQNLSYNPLGILTPPSTPSSGVAIQNTFHVSVQIFIIGGTISAIAIGNTSGGTSNTGLTSSSSGVTVRLDPGQWIKLTYTVSPTWAWFGS